MTKNFANAPDDEAPPPYSPHAETPAYNPAFFASPSVHRSEPPHTPASAPEPSAPPSPAPQRASLYPQLPTTSSTYSPHTTRYHVQHHTQYDTQQGAHANSLPRLPHTVYQTFAAPPQRYYPRHMVIPPEQVPLMLRRTHSGERRFPIGAMLFLAGWFCPLLWIFGACCCTGSRNPYEAWWGKLNFIMTIILIASSILCSMFAVSIGDWITQLQS